jgi:hypothetical protein
MKKSLIMGAVFLLPSIALAGATVSTFKKESRKGANFYAGNAAIDSKLETAWVVPGESPNRGEWIMLDVPKGTIDKIGIYPGFGDSDEAFSDHPRVKKMKVEVICCQDDDFANVQGAAHFDVQDKAEMQTIDIDDLDVGNELFGGRVRISVVDIYEGVDFPNVGIAEILVHMKEFDAAPVVSESSDENPDHINMDMVDDNPKTFFATASAGAYFTFNSDGYGLSSVVITQGPKGYDRLKKVKVEVDGNRFLEVDIAEDHKGDIVLPVPAVYGYTGTSSFDGVKVEVLEVYPGNGEIAISELKAKATYYEGL